MDRKRLSRINNLRTRLAQCPTPHEKRFQKFMSGVCAKGTPLWFTPQKVVHVHQEQAFILDFYFKESKVAVEIDGSFHSGRKEYDNWRTSVLETHRITVVRFLNNEIEQDVHKCVACTVAAIESRLSQGGKKRLHKHLTHLSESKPQLYKKITASTGSTPS